MADNPAIVRRLVILSGLAIVLVSCLIFFSSASSREFPLPSAPSTSPPLINPESLHNWLPDTSYNNTIDKLRNFFQTNNIRANYMIAQGISTDSGNYDFTIVLEPQHEQHKVSVYLANLSPAISTTVSIDGQEQGYKVSDTNSGVSFENMDALINVGVTAVQANELQLAFKKFDPNTLSVRINSGSIVSPPANPNSSALSSTYTFTVKIEDRTYHAKIICTDLDKIELILIDPGTNKQTFDSGQITDLNQ